jgi:predicted permease
MMVQSQIVLLKIGMMFLVMVAGWWASRRDYLTPASTRAMSILVVQLAFPALVFVQMMGTVTVEALRRGWWIPVFAVVSMVLAAGVGRLLIPFSRREPFRRRTFTFLVAVPNWVFLPLPIAGGLYGAEGIRFVLLYNFGAQIVLWTLGVRILQGGKPGVPVWQSLLSNSGIWATLAGVAVALLWPGAAIVGKSSPGTGWWLLGDGIMAALRMIGDLTIPLSLLATGAQLGSLATVAHFKWRPLAGVMLGRLIVAPVATILLLKGMELVLGMRMSEADFITAAIIAAMPVAISCTMFAERFEGDGELSASAVFWTTLVSLATVPVMVFACHWLV